MVKLKEFMLFGLAGVFGYVADVIVTLLLEPILGVYVGRLPAFIAAATTTWLINRNLTFRKRRSTHTSLFREYINYVSLMVFGVVVNYVVYVVAVTVLQGDSYAVLFSIALGSIAGMLVNYITSKRYIYNQSRS